MITTMAAETQTAHPPQPMEQYSALLEVSEAISAHRDLKALFKE
jgi:hypothetical protein